MNPPTLTLDATTALYVLGAVAVVAFFVGRGTAYDLVRDVTREVCDTHRELAERLADVDEARASAQKAAA